MRLAKQWVCVLALVAFVVAMFWGLQAAMLTKLVLLGGRKTSSAQHVDPADEDAETAGSDDQQDGPQD